MPGNAQSAATRKTILLAEDDDDLREVVTFCLESAGLNVVACRNAELASDAFRSGTTVDMLMTDFQMPGRSGIELARELTRLRPSLPVMIVSGSLFSRETLREIEQRNWVYVSKPCHPTVLLNTTHVLLKTGQCNQLLHESWPPLQTPNTRELQLKDEKTS